MHVFSTHKRRRVALVAAVAVVAIGGGISAYAYWTADGTGLGTATTGTAGTFSIFTSDPTGGPLTPGGPSEQVDFHVDNPTTGTQLLSAMNVTVANPDGTPWTAVTGCSAADYAISGITVPFGEIAAAGSVNGSVTITMVNTDLNQDACQGVTVPLYFTTTPPD